VFQFGGLEALFEGAKPPRGDGTATTTARFVHALFTLLDLKY